MIQARPLPAWAANKALFLQVAERPIEGRRRNIGYDRVLPDLIKPNITISAAR